MTQRVSAPKTRAGRSWRATKASSPFIMPRAGCRRAPTNRCRFAAARRPVFRRRTCAHLFGNLLQENDQLGLVIARAGTSRANIAGPLAHVGADCGPILYRQRHKIENPFLASRTGDASYVNKSRRASLADQGLR